MSVNKLALLDFSYAVYVFNARRLLTFPIHPCLVCHVSLQALSQPPAARSSGVVSGSPSLSSYQEYPAHHPFVNTPQTRARLSQPPASPSKALPETNSAGDFQSRAPVLVCMQGSFRLGIVVVRRTMATACAT